METHPETNYKSFNCMCVKDSPTQSYIVDLDERSFLEIRANAFEIAEGYLTFYDGEIPVACFKSWSWVYVKKYGTEHKPSKSVNGFCLKDN